VPPLAAKLGQTPGGENVDEQVAVLVLFGAQALDVDAGAVPAHFVGRNEVEAF
jgi:electron transfer flavoprotein alpha/beta subunit